MNDLTECLQNIRRAKVCIMEEKNCDHLYQEILKLQKKVESIVEFREKRLALMDNLRLKDRRKIIDITR